MSKNLRSRTLLIAVVTLACLVILFGPWNKPKDYQRTAGDFFKPSNLRQNLADNIRLGLDLKGGTHLVMQVQGDETIGRITEGNVQKAQQELKAANIPFTKVEKTANGTLVVETPDTSKQGEIRDKLLPFFGSDGWDVTTSASPAKVTFNLTSSAAKQIRQEATEQAKTIIEQRIDAFGVAEPTIQLYGNKDNHQILVQMPGVDDPERVKKLVGGESRLEIRAVEGGPNPQKFTTLEEAQAAIGTATDKEALPYVGTRSEVGNEGGYYIVPKVSVIDGSDLREARGVPNQQGGAGWQVSFSNKPIGAEKFGNWTGANVGNYLAVVLDGKIQSVAVVNDKITDSGVIQGSFTQQQAEDLGLTLRSGALPAKVLYLEERTVGPSLGAESIRQGLIALLAGVVFVAGFMIFYYRLSGVNAVVALILNLVILLAGLAVFNATLTLPGIAGVILGIGMAVDANVLVFERIRDELRIGRLAAAAVDAGFSKAIVTIIDTHVTTVVSAAILYLFGTGPIRGFAVTLVISLLANLFTAVFVSRTMFMWVLNRGGRRAATTVSV